jgi:flavin-dependent dehydrogenase
MKIKRAGRRMEKFDIIIVGAGPAGLMAGIMNAQSGAEVLIVGKKPTTGRPVKCAECIAADVFKDINLKPEPDRIASRINKEDIHSPGDRVVHIKAPFKGYVLNRAIFEADLAEITEKHGAHLQLSTPVAALSGGGIVHTRDKQVKGGIITGADGIRSYIGRCAGIETGISRKDVGIGIQFLAHNHNYYNNRLSLFLNQTYASRDYAWIFPESFFHTWLPKTKGF